ncbi:MAG TPA: SRPBCC family protein [Solirubrobacteraceae bacterium]|nr:SRPBCC family protein [Solirubrobacteraceae bacterium]
MPTARRSRTIAAPAGELWDVVRDPHHLPRWWPRVTRVEDVEGDAFTEVMKTAKGRLVRADFTVDRADEHEHALSWTQHVEGTPFARVLRSAETEVRLRPLGAAGAGDAVGAGARADGPAAPSDDATAVRPATEVTIELRQSLTGFFPRFGGFMVRRAAAATIEQALDGLERISG